MILNFYNPLFLGDFVEELTVFDLQVLPQMDNHLLTHNSGFVDGFCVTLETLFTTHKQNCLVQNTTF